MRKHQAWLEKPGGRGGGDLAAAGGTGAGHQQRGARGAGQAGARGPGGARAAAEVGRGGLRRRSWRTESDEAPCLKYPELNKASVHMPAGPGNKILGCSCRALIRLLYGSGAHHSRLSLSGQLHAGHEGLAAQPGGQSRCRNHCQGLGLKGQFPSKLLKE